MKALHVKNDAGEHWGYTFFCPGCRDTHAIPTKPHAHGWGSNDSTDAPTFTPSILVHEAKREDGTVVIPQCHSYVTDGRIQFLPDSRHALAGKTVDLPEWKGYGPDSYERLAPA